MTGQNMKRLGDYIRPVDVRNRDLKVTRLMGINIEKRFMPSVANVVGTDLSNYKVVSKGQFACNLMHVGRDEKIPVALQKDDEPIIVSPAYVVFEVVDTNVLLTEYLMMWFSRSEFDRNAWFYTDGDVRGGMDREALFDMQIPVPTIEKQREIVAEYNTLATRIETNKKLIATLEQTAQTLYRHTFVDNIDPNNLLQGWEYKSVFDIAEVRYGFPFNSELFCSDSSLNPIVRIRDILEESTDTYSSETADEKYLIQKNDILIGMDGIFHMTIWSNASMWQNQRIVRVRCLNKSLMSAYQIMFSIYAPIKSLESSIEGTTVAHLSDKDMKKLKILVAPEIVQNDITQKLNSILEVVENKKSETRMLAQMQTLFLSKMGA